MWPLPVLGLLTSMSPDRMSRSKSSQRQEGEAARLTKGCVRAAAVSRGRVGLARAALVALHIQLGDNNPSPHLMMGEGQVSLQKGTWGAGERCGPLWTSKFISRSKKLW